MLCQNCGKNEANVRYTQIVNGNKKEMVLCEECAEKMGISNFKVSMPISFSNFLGDFFDDYDEQLLPSFMKEKNNECNNCGELYDDFIKTGLLGCSDCYDIFSDRLDSVLKNIQGNTRHVGRKPLNIDSKMNNTGENKVVNKKGTSKEEKESDKLEKLQADLKNAIKEERYEDAAEIRDEIKKLSK